MLFNSAAFLLFAPIALLGHTLLKGRALRLWMIAASYVFYGWADPRYILLLVFSTVLDYNIGRAMGGSQSEGHRRNLLALSVAGNLGLLAVFKYGGFFTRQVNALWGLLGLTVALPVWEPPLPVGISFYTFQTLSYTIDVYRRRMEPTQSFTTFALFVAFFPQLVAGPIERARHLLPQLQEKMARTADDIAVGTTRILWGLTKKIVFADWLAIYVDSVYSAHEAARGFELLIATYAFAFQIYLDFSAYTDIAIGLARLMGIDLRENFRWPYLSRNLSEFWQRWHISLSTWLRDYLYFELGGSREGRGKTLRNLVVVMFLGGLWHGAAWTFVVWGLWIGLGLAVYHRWAATTGARSHKNEEFALRDIPGVVLTFHFVLVSWVFFRASSMSQAWAILTRVATDWGTHYTVTFYRDIIITLGVLSLAGTAHLVRGLGLTERAQAIRSPLALGAFWAVMIATMLTFYAPASARFIYFQF